MVWTTKSILALLKEINEKYGITIVVITHEMSVIQEICRHVAVLEHGNLVETGTTEELFRAPKTAEAIAASAVFFMPKVTGELVLPNWLLTSQKVCDIFTS